MRTYLDESPEECSSNLQNAGNAVKAGVRFVSYDHFKHALADAEVSSPCNLSVRQDEPDVHVWVRAKCLPRGVFSRASVRV